MTDRIRTFTVILTEDMRDDDVAVVLSAIRQNRYVADVIPGPAVTMVDHIQREIAKRELRRELDAVLETKS